MKGLGKKAGLLPASWWPKDPATWAEVLHALHMDESKMSKVIALRDVDASIGKACLRLGVRYHGFALSESHRVFMLKVLDAYAVTLMCDCEMKDWYVGEEASHQIADIFGFAHPEAGDELHGDSSCDDWSDVASSDAE